MVDKVTRNFVPVAANLYKIREAKDEAGEFFRGARSQKNQYQGIWIIAPDGTVLAGHQDFKTRESWADEVAATIDAALAKAGSLTVRKPEPKDVMPHWGKGVLADGGVTLACQMRYFFQNKGIGQGALDEAAFTAKEWKEFAPPEPVKGKSWHLAGKVASEFSRCLSIVSDRSTMPRPSEVTEVEFTGTVERIRNGVATVSYAGYIAALHTHTFNKNYVTKAHARMRGTGTYDVVDKEMVSLLWIFEGGSRTVQPPRARTARLRRWSNGGVRRSADANGTWFAHFYDCPSTPRLLVLGRRRAHDATRGGHEMVITAEPGTIRAGADRPLYILIVEDNRDGRESLRTLLQLHGYHVDVAADGIEGVAMAKLGHPDVALVDIGLPRLDGYEVAPAACGPRQPPAAHGVHRLRRSRCAPARLRSGLR